MFAGCPYRCTGHGYGLRGGNERIGCRDDFIPGPDTQAPQSEIEGIRTVANAHTILCIAEVCKFLFEGLNVLPPDKGRLGNDFMNYSVNLILNGGILFF